MFTPSLLVTYKTPDIITLKKNLVGPSSQMSQLKKTLWQQYHIKDDVKKMTTCMAQDEIALRLIYEIIFNKVPIECVSNGTWLSRDIRDDGHTQRMRRLWGKASKAPLKYPWIAEPRPKYIK